MLIIPEIRKKEIYTPGKSGRVRIKEVLLYEEGEWLILKAI